MADQHTKKTSIGPGSLIGGKFAVIRELGHGAMGDVFICHHKDLGNKEFVVKVLRPEIAKNENIIQRFNNEVIAALDVSHENVVRAYEFIKEDDLVAYSMEYIRGGDLADEMDELLNFPIVKIFDYLKQILRGTDALHQKGIIHRDLKPENILISDKGVLKISDFGISVFDNESRMTEAGSLLGSTNYIAPEYIERQIVNEQIDIYAIGIIIYELATGTDPFPGDNIYIKLKQRTKFDPQDPREYREDLPSGIAELILRMIARDPNDRFFSCQQILEELDDLNLHTGEYINPNRIRDRNPQVTREFELDTGDSNRLSQSINTEAIKSEKLNVSYNSELIDFSNRDSSAVYQTTALVKQKKSKSIFPKILTFVILLLVSGIVTLYVTNPQTFKSLFAGGGPSSSSGRSIDDTALADRKNLNPAVRPESIDFKQTVDRVRVSFMARLQQNNLSDLAFKAIFPESADGQAYLKSITSTDLVSNKIGKYSFDISTRAIVEIQNGQQLIVRPGTINLTGFEDSRTGKFKVEITSPENMNIGLKGYGVKQIGKIFTAYYTGNIILDEQAASVPGAPDLPAK